MPNYIGLTWPLVSILYCAYYENSFTPLSYIVHYLKIGYVFGQGISDLLTKVRPYALRGGVAWPLGAVESNSIWPFFIWSNKERHCASV